MSKAEIVTPIGASANEIYQYEFLKVLVWNRFAKAAMTGAFCRASHHSINKKVKLLKLKSSLVRKLSKPRLRFIIVIVQSKTKIVQIMHIVQTAARIIRETISK